MSRFEPSVEPSMEEILASIRRIIAEDTSGSRSVPPPAPSRAQPSAFGPNSGLTHTGLPHPGPALADPTHGVRPTASPQRGFMSREAFMRSSAPADEPGEQRFFTPVTPQDPLPAAEVQPAAPGRAEEKVSPSAPSSSPARDAKVEAKPAEPIVTAKASPEPEKLETLKPEKSEAVSEISKSETSETVSEASKANETVEAGVGDEVKTVVEAEQKTLTPEPKSEAEIIDAQLVDLLGEVKALREVEERHSEKKPEAEAPAAAEAASETPVAPAPAEPRAYVNGSSSKIASSPSVESDEEISESRDNSDPFAFDLGPSPFLPRSSAGRVPERKISAGSTPPSHQQSQSQPQRGVGWPRDDAPASTARGWPKGNGVSAPTEHPTPIAPPRRYETPAAIPAPQHPAPFAVPSVSATLGPHHRLEPLSDAFKPAPPDYRKPVEPPADPFPFREFGRSAEAPVEPRRDPHEGRLQPAAPPPLSALPPLDAEASPVVGGDRTMEDAVADLLRPLLKTWLAENMPKIVERALRREMTERLLPNQKNSRD